VVTLPADAKLKVDGVATTSISSSRRFVTPALEPGKEYFYTLEAEVVNDGKLDVITRRVQVQAGRETHTNLTPAYSTAKAR
jgi:uncharacterized protein (TIGR03000 family)